MVVCGLPLALLLARRRFRGAASWRRWSACRSCCRPRWLATTCCSCWAAAAQPSNGSAGKSFSPGAPRPLRRRSWAFRSLCYQRRAIAGVDPALEHAARTLGSSEIEVTRRITLPLARRGILAGLVLGATRASGEFGATLMVAGSIPGRTQTLPLALYDAVQNRQYDQANAMVLLLTVLAFVSLWAVRRFEQPRQSFAASAISPQERP